MSDLARAVRVSGETSIDGLTFDEIRLPELKYGEVLVAIKAVSLNFRDTVVVAGKYAKDMPKPLVIASDGAGEVLAIGEGVTKWKKGDHVMGSFFQTWLDGEPTDETVKSALGGAIDGVLTTRKIFHQSGLVRIPSHLSFEEGATLPCAAVTAWHALVPTARLKSGDTVLLLGTGGVSIFGLQFAKLHGARTIITSSSDEKLQRARSLGADDTINYKTTPEWHKEVLKRTGGRGVDVVLEVGGAGTLGSSLRATRSAGQVAVIGVLSGISQQLNIAPIFQRNLRVQGIYVGSVKMFEDMNAAIDTNKMKPVIDRTFSFEQSKDALRYMESGAHFGKIVIRVAE